MKNLFFTILAVILFSLSACNSREKFIRPHDWEDTSIEDTEFFISHPTGWDILIIDKITFLESNEQTLKITLGILPESYTKELKSKKDHFDSIRLGVEDNYRELTEETALVNLQEKSADVVEKALNTIYYIEYSIKWINKDYGNSIIYADVFTPDGTVFQFTCNPDNFEVTETIKQLCLEISGSIRK